MKKLFLICVLTGLVFSANAANETRTPDIYALQDSVKVTEGDTTEYELVVFDPGFKSWFLTNRKPKWSYDNKYYKTKNQLYVAEWNNRVRQYMSRPPYEFRIEYDPTEEYGLDVNWKLYWYFKYLEDKYGIRFFHE